MEINEIKKDCGNEKKAVEKFCKSTCKICRSDFLEEIHSLKRGGANYSEIISAVKKKLAKRFPRLLSVGIFKITTNAQAEFPMSSK